MKSFVRFTTVFSLALSLMCLGLSGTANAFPKLQLDIDGGVYDPVTETVMATTNPFDLYAFATPSGNVSSTDILNSNNFYLSVALTPQTLEPGGTYGSFSVNGTTVNVTSGMIFGTPPITAVLTSEDLPSHDIFETYYKEFSVDFVTGDQTTPYNTQNDTDFPTTPLSGTGMYYDMFTIDMAGLDSDFGLHFDLYHVAADGTIDYFAPFSHDAGGPPVPEPATFLLLGSGMAALAAFRRRQDRK